MTFWTGGSDLGDVACVDRCDNTIILRLNMICPLIGVGSVLFMV